MLLLGRAAVVLLAASCAVAFGWYQNLHYLCIKLKNSSEKTTTYLIPEYKSDGITTVYGTSNVQYDTV